MLIGKPNHANHNQDGHQCHEQDVSRVPKGVLAGCCGCHDVGNVLDDLLLKGHRNLRVSFVSNSLLGRYHIAGRLDELNGQRSEGGRSLVGQLVGVLDEALGKDPVGECSSNQIKNSQSRDLFSRCGATSS